MSRAPFNRPLAQRFIHRAKLLAGIIIIPTVAIWSFFGTYFAFTTDPSQWTPVELAIGLYSTAIAATLFAAALAVGLSYGWSGLVKLITRWIR